ncbi:hypothetical protein CBP31_05645 [Oceanisphaera profunda]|uniref:Inverse autotransporter beta-domain domain-containing protein n=1 Tax=Oceanisphaera profunda TaxID=1416627 RepID=A0A1Y0D4D6_9GAMM|nr:hypothetical protein CBP31_05645 [Oceanisphaera profunda]
MKKRSPPVTALKLAHQQSRPQPNARIGRGLSVVLGACLLSASFSSQAAGPLMVMHQVAAGETWRLVAKQHQLTERQLRLHYNQTRFMTPLTPGDWIWVPNSDSRAAPATLSQTDTTAFETKATDLAQSASVLPSKPTQDSTHSEPMAAAASVPIGSEPATLAKAQRDDNLPRLGPPDPTLAPKTAQLKLTLASAAQAAANHKLDKFVEQHSSSLADSTLSFGSQQLSDWLWLSPEHWSWDYQLPLFDKELLFNSSLALPLGNQLQGEVGIDYRDQRLTYQAGLNIERELGGSINAHLEPVLDYQAGWDHQRGGVLLYLAEPDWTLGAGQYQPLSGWQQQEGRSERAAAGQVVFGEGRLGWVPGLSVSSQFYQWQGRRLNLYGSGDKYKAPMSRQWSLNYTPWQILRLQSSLLSNSKGTFESRLRLGVELPLGLEPGLWWKSVLQQADYRHYQPLQHHQVLVLEQK